MPQHHQPAYGTAFEELSDEEKSSVSRRPKGIQDEIVTDERGRRRFHGAFTGGFSAGYFNTAGSKEGWVPQTFKSTRERRAEQVNYNAEDFMDAEDLGEFGIAHKRLRTKEAFAETALAVPGGRQTLAWERASSSISLIAATSSSASSNKGVGHGEGVAGELFSGLSEVLRPISSDSIGVKLLKKMGWREGKGIGPTMSRRALERQRVQDAKSRGQHHHFNEEAVREMEEHAPKAMEFAPEDVSAVEFEPKENLHGLGYTPLQDKGVLAEHYGHVAATLKTTKQGRGIRGQAFGVGVFEDDDEDIYTNYDLTQYDFELGGAATKQAQEQDARRYGAGTEFVPATKPLASNRKFFTGPRVPHDFRPGHNQPHQQQRQRGTVKGHQKEQGVTEVLLRLKLPERVQLMGRTLTPFQRARFLGERDPSVMALLSKEDREFLEAVKSRREAGAQEAAGRVGVSRAQPEPFEEEPLKAHRYKKYVQFLKRGLEFPPPAELTRLEWEHELAEFQRVLPPELRSLLPEVKARQQPLAKLDFAQPIADLLKSRFHSEGGMEDSKEGIRKEVDRLQAVRSRKFGASTTRQQYTWYPAKELCKRFNVPNPFPDSNLRGVLELNKRSSRVGGAGSDFSLVQLGLPNTATELRVKRERQEAEADIAAAAKKLDTERDSKAEVAAAKPKSELKAPWELLEALFNEEEENSEEVENDERESEEDVAQDGEELSAEQRQQLIEQRMLESVVSTRRGGHRSTLFPSTTGTASTEAAGGSLVGRVVTVDDIVEDEGVFGPALPPPLTPASNAAEKKESRHGVGIGQSSSATTSQQESSISSLLRAQLLRRSRGGGDVQVHEVSSDSSESSSSSDESEEEGERRYRKRIDDGRSREDEANRHKARRKKEEKREGNHHHRHRKSSKGEKHSKKHKKREKKEKKGKSKKKHKS